MLLRPARRLAQNSSAEPASGTRTAWPTTAIGSSPMWSVPLLRRLRRLRRPRDGLSRRAPQCQLAGDVAALTAGRRPAVCGHLSARRVLGEPADGREPEEIGDGNGRAEFAAHRLMEPEQ